jgi:hypothetical protein
VQELGAAAATRSLPGSALSLAENTIFGMSFMGVAEGWSAVGQGQYPAMVWSSIPLMTSRIPLSPALPHPVANIAASWQRGVWPYQR